MNTLNTPLHTGEQPAPQSDELRASTTTDVANLMPCQAIEGKDPRATLLLGNQGKTLLLSHNQDGTWYSVLGNSIQFPKNIVISGKNVSVSHFWDGSIRLEPLDTSKITNTDDGFRGNSTRLDVSETTLILEGELYTNPIIVLDGK